MVRLGASLGHVLAAATAVCCALALAALIGPRVAIVVWWLFDASRWALAFQGTWILPLLGLLFLPWTTLAFVAFAPTGTIDVLAAVALVIALIVDLGAYGGGFRGRR